MTFVSFLKAEWPLITPALMIVGFLVYGWWENANRSPDADTKSRLSIYNKTLFMLWALAAACFAGWLLSGQPVQAIGLTWTKPGWGGWAAWGVVLLGIIYLIYTYVTLTRSANVRQQIRDQLAGLDLDFMRPRTPVEHARFKALSVTAGLTEEIIFRGFLIALFSMFLPFGIAVVTAVILFGVGHLYQGLSGVFRTTLVGGILTAIYLIGGSLWPAIILHILIDLSAGVQFQLIDRFADDDGSDVSGFQRV